MNDIVTIDDPILASVMSPETRRAIVDWFKLHGRAFAAASGHPAPTRDHLALIVDALGSCGRHEADALVDWLRRYAAADREADRRRLEALGGRRPLDVEQRAELWRARLTPTLPPSFRWGITTPDPGKAGRGDLSVSGVT